MKDHYRFTFCDDILWLVGLSAKEENKTTVLVVVISSKVPKPDTETPLIWINSDNDKDLGDLRHQLVTT